MGINDGFDGMIILIASRWIQNVISVNRINNRLIDICILTNKSILKIVSVYDPQTAHTLEEKDVFHDKMLGGLLLILEIEILLACADFNCHVGKFSNSFDYVHDNQGFGTNFFDTRF